MNDIQFEVGQQYENRKGVYEILAIDGDSMRIRWQTGEEVVTTVTLQHQIIERMQRKPEEQPPVNGEVSPAKRKPKTPATYSRKSKGFSASDFFK